MQTILGSGGIIGVELAKNLPKHTDKIRLVSRKPKKVHHSNELFPCDLTNLEQVKNAVKGSLIILCSDVIPDALDLVKQFKEQEAKGELEFAE